MKKKISPLFLAVVALLSFVQCTYDREEVDGWAVLLEMNNYPLEWEDLDFIDSERMKDALLSLGWQDDHLYVKRGNMTVPAVQEALDWLGKKTDVGDVAFLYIATYTRGMHNVLRWNDWFPSAWQTVNTPRRILIIDTCWAGEFIESVRADPRPHISLAACRAGEYVWSSNIMPIKGRYWTYYLTNALCDSTADSDKNGFVSVEEAFNFSTPLVQKHYCDKLQEYYPSIDLCHPANYDTYVDVHPEMDDQYPEQLYLDLRFYERKSALDKLGITRNGMYAFIVMTIALVATTVYLARRKPKAV